MVLWPVGLALVAAWAVFHDPAFDYRLLAAGALAPTAVDTPFTRLGIGHTLLAAVLTMTGVMVATRHRRAARRHAIAVPIGMLLALVATGMWTKPRLLWWPALGAHLLRPGLVPPPAVLVIEELTGAVLIGWFVRRFELRDASYRRVWWRTGRLAAAR